MKSRKIVLITLLVMFILPVWIRPVHAMQHFMWSDESPTEYEGTWNTLNNYAREGLVSSVYKLNVVFTIYNIPTDADDYWVHIDYNYMSPGWPWAESLDVMYRWGMGGSWTHIAYYDYWSSDANWDISSASSSIFQLKIRACAETTDGVQTTWSFGDEPILHAYWD